MLKFFKKRDTPIFISILEYGEEIALKGATETEFIGWFKDKYPEASQSEERLSRVLFRECFQRTTGVRSLVLRNEYFFRLIEYRELQEARKASSQANRNSWIAVSISLVAIGISIWFGWQQLNNPIELGEQTLTRIENAKTSSH